MQVTLTNHQARSVINRVDGRYGERMVQHRKPRGKTKHDYFLPAIAWRQILDHLLANSFGPLGGRRQDQPDSLYTAIAHIQAAVSEREHHPALRHEAIAAVSPEMFPVWMSDSGWSPYPTGELRNHFVMIPRAYYLKDHLITEWSPVTPSLVLARLDEYPLAIEHQLEFVTAP